VDDLGRDPGISRSALAERFTLLTGEPPMQYLNRLRLRYHLRAFLGGEARQLTEFHRVSIVNMTCSEGKRVATTVSAAKAKAQFAECMRKAEAGDPVVITRHGRAVVALVRADRLQQLERLGSAGPAAGLAGLAGGWRGSEELVRLLAGSRRTKARRVPRLGR
jgi:prevent-host-death family protein